MRSCGSRGVSIAGALALCVGWSSIAAAANISATGGWSRPIDANDLIAGAGSDLVSVYESASNATLIDIFAGNNTDWRVDVRKADNIWGPALALHVRRTGDGIGRSPVTGGLSYQLVTDTSMPFFSGRGKTGLVPVQYKLAGVSILLMPRTYSVTVSFTLITY